jgi:hypothetical protein
MTIRAFSAGLIVLASFALTTAVSAQVIVNIPSFPKIKKEKPKAEPTTPSNGSATSTTSETVTTGSKQQEMSTGRSQSCAGDSFFDVHNENIQATIKEAEEYKPGMRDYYVSQYNDRQNIYLKAAISKKKRAEWEGDWKDADNTIRCINAELDKLAEVARRTLPTYRPTGYDVHNPAEEKILKSAITDISQATVLGSGLKSTNWKIDKDDYGLPSARFKYGMVWLKYPNLDDGFCRIVYVNIVQDYAGGGTYNDSEGRFITVEPAGCPPGK